MKKKAMLALLVLGATSLSLVGCNNGSVEEDLRTADEFLLDIDYVNVNWEAFQYTYDWANLENGGGEAMERVITLTEKNFYPYGSQVETWWNVRNLEPTGNGSTETFYFANGYGFEPASGTAWTYSDTYDDAVDNYLDGIDLQIAWEYSEGYEYVSDVDLEYTDKVLTGVTFHHYAETEGVGYVNDSYTYRTDKNGRLTQYIYEELTHVEQEYQGELVTLDIYAKHDLGEIPAEDVIVPEFNLGDYDLEDDNFGYDVTLPEIPGQGTVIDSYNLGEEEALAFINAVNLNDIYNWTGYAFDKSSKAEGGSDEIEYLSQKGGKLYGFVEEYTGSGVTASLTDSLFYNNGSLYEYAPAGSGEAASLTVSSSNDTLAGYVSQRVYDITYYYEELQRDLVDPNYAPYAVLENAHGTVFEEGTTVTEITYRISFSASDYILYDLSFYEDSDNNLIGFTYDHASAGDGSETVVVLYEVDYNTVEANLPQWVKDYGLA